MGARQRLWRSMGEQWVAQEERKKDGEAVKHQRRVSQGVRGTEEKQKKVKKRLEV
jgi:hypothetical protein